MAKAMARSRAEVVPATVHDVAKIDAWPAGSDPTLRLIRAVVAGIRAEPLLNVAFDAERGELSFPSTIDLGLALNRPEGLYVPVVRNAGELDDAARRAELERLKQAVVNRSVSRADLASPSFTLSNFGPLAGRHASLVIVPPQVAILGAGRIEEQVVALDGEVRIGRMLPLSLTFDHRVITGGEAARFLAAVISDLEDDEDPSSGI
jgi:pyruvate dehydrogenase E2 component (dihydrolipoamide acetyltransferase)